MKKVFILSGIIILILTILVSSVGCSTDANGLTYEQASQIGEENYSYSFGANGSTKAYANSYEIQDSVIILHDVWSYNETQRTVWEKNDIVIVPVNYPFPINKTSKFKK